MRDDDVSPRAYVSADEVRNRPAPLALGSSSDQQQILLAFDKAIRDQVCLMPQRRDSNDELTYNAFAATFRTDV